MTAEGRPPQEAPLFPHMQMHVSRKRKLVLKKMENVEIFCFSCSSHQFLESFINATGLIASHFNSIAFSKKNTDIIPYYYCFRFLFFECNIFIFMIKENTILFCFLLPKLVIIRYYCSFFFYLYLST